MLKTLAYWTAAVLHPRLFWGAARGQRQLAKAYSLTHAEAGRLIERIKRIDRNLGPHWSAIMREGVAVCVARYGLNKLQHVGLLNRLAELSEPTRALEPTELAALIETYAEQMLRAGLVAERVNQVKGAECHGT